MTYSFIVTHVDQIGQFILAIGIVGLGFIQKKYFKHQVEKAQEIHILVNSQKQDLETRIKELEAQLAKIRTTVQADVPSNETQRDEKP